MKYILINIFFFLWFTCGTSKIDTFTKHEDDLLSDTYRKVETSDSLKKYISFFLDNNPCKHKYNSLYIDVVNDCSVIITIQNYFVPKSDYGIPLLYTQIDSSVFFIYTGIEKYFVGDMNIMPVTNFRNPNCEITTWKIIDSVNTFTLFRDVKVNPLPFSEVPCSEFSSVHIDGFR